MFNTILSLLIIIVITPILIAIEIIGTIISVLVSPIILLVRYIKKDRIKGIKMKPTSRTLKKGRRNKPEKHRSYSEKRNRGEKYD